MTLSGQKLLHFVINIIVDVMMMSRDEDDQDDGKDCLKFRYWQLPSVFMMRICRSNKGTPLLDNVEKPGLIY